MRIMFSVGFLLGVIVGIYLSPVKNGIRVTNYNQCENLSDLDVIKRKEFENEHEQN